MADASVVTAPVTTALSARGISKRFSGQRALDSFDIDVRPGEIHALLGHNGSGKSTFIKVLAGVYSPEPGGSVTVRGRQVPHGSPREAYRSGLRFVHQRLAVVDQLSAEDNLALGRGFHTRAGIMIDWRRQRAETDRTLRMLDEGTSWQPGRPLGAEPAITRARLAIGRALVDLTDGGILVLDEPTAALAPHEVEQLFASLARVRARGISIIYVTHRLREVYEIADRMTLLREGRSLGTYDADALPMQELVGMLVGDAGGRTAARQEHTAAARDGAERVLEVQGLTAPGLADVTFEVGAGEVLGVCGLEGSGRESFASAVTGALPARAGKVRTRRGAATRVDLKTAGRLGIVLARESRAPGALVDQFSVAENLSLRTLSSFAAGGVVRHRKETRFARTWIRQLRIRPGNPRAVLGEMSGGNRQKVVIARALSSNPEVLVLDEPTAGVDIGASVALHELFREVAASGRGVVLVSSDMEELVAVADRVLVLREGRAVAVVPRAELSESRLLSEVG